MNNQLSPEYSQILQGIGKQLSERKGLLARRVLLIVWPYILLGIAIFIIPQIYELNSLNENHEDVVIRCGSFLYGLCAVIYSILMGFVFNIEKRIWVDSYFDNRPLTSTQSQRVSWRLVWPVFKFRFALALAYYWIPMITLIVAIFVGFYLWGTVVGEADNFAMSLIYTAFASLFVIPISVFVYQYWVRVKLRYAWFIFLDHYGQDYSFKLLQDEVKKLNNISKTDAFLKSLVINIGGDSAAAVSNLAVQGITAGFGMLGNTGKLVGQVTRIYGEELTRQVTDLGNIAGQYILYRFARKQLYGDEQKINEVLYSLKD